MTDTEPSISLPTLDQVLAAQFQDRVAKYANALRELADTVESHATRLGTTPGLRQRPITATEIAASIQHEIEWGLANASASQIITAAADYDQR